MSAEDGASWTGGGVQAAAAAPLLDASRPGSGSGPRPCACAVDDARQLRVGEGEPDRRCGPGSQTGSAGPAETAATAGKL